MKTMIIGYSGSGKSTLAKALGKADGAAVLNLDRVHWLPGWEERDWDEAEMMVKEFMDSHESWVIEGNYQRLLYERRLAEADRIIFMNFNRFTCLRRAWKRYRACRGTTRDSMTEGCLERLDFEFICWILRDGRTKKQRTGYENVMKRFSEKAVVIRNQKELDMFVKNAGLKTR